MNTYLRVLTLNIAGLGMLVTFLVCGAAGESLGRVELHDISGATEFEAPTNVPAVSVKGKSNSLQGNVTIAREADGILLEHLEVWAPVKTLGTGMGVRDEHMRKQVFTNSQGHTPDLRFEADKAVCSARSGQEFVCQVAGNLSIRGISRPFAMSLKVKQAGQSAFKAGGEAIVKLSDYEIIQPTQFGVKVSNEMKVRFELTSKQHAVDSASGGGHH